MTYNIHVVDWPWITVVETLTFQARAKSRLTEAQVEEVIETVANDPRRGAVMRGTGGVRKLRFGAEGRGKSGGVRVIYYYYNDDIPVFLISVYAKNEQVNLSMATRNDLAKLTRILVETYGDKK